jgi:hypothetical protein
MCCEQLVCAACGGRVSDGGCGRCRAYRDAHHGASADPHLPVVPLLALLAMVVLLVVLHTQLA